jgi:protein involved in polysaccharide export with SLBB domain
MAIPLSRVFSLLPLFIVLLASPGHVWPQLASDRTEASPAARQLPAASATRIQDTLNEPDSVALEPLYKDLISFIRQATGRDTSDVLEMQAPRNLGSRVTDRYTIGVGDTIELQIWGSINGQFELVVDAGGRVFVPQIGSINLQGVKHRDLSNVVRAQIARVHKGFDVRAQVLQSRTIDIQVSGSARRVGVHSVPGTTSLLGASLSFSSPTGLGSRRFLELRRGATRQKIDLYCFFRDSCEGLPEQLLDGDVLHVPLRTRLVALTGPVGRPGIYELSESENFDDLIKYAGGLSVVADRERLHMYSFQRSGETNTNFTIVGISQLCGSTAKESGNCRALRDGDYIDVQPQAPLVSGRVTVVAPDGVSVHMPFKAGMRLLDVVHGSLRKLLPNALLVRINNPNFQLAESLDQSLGRLDLASISLMRFDAGKREYVPIRVDVAAAQAGGPASAENLSLQDGDIIAIDEQSEWKSPRDGLVFTVRVLGEINRPGTVRFSGVATLGDALAAAGGTTNKAAIWSALVLRQGDGRESINKEMMDRAFAAIRDSQRKRVAVDAASGGAPGGAPNVTELGRSRSDSIVSASERRELSQLLRGRELIFLSGKSGLQRELELKPGDIVLVPPESLTFACYGAFFRVGHFSGEAAGTPFEEARDRCGVIDELEPIIYLVSARDQRTCREKWYSSCGVAKGGDKLIAEPRSVEKTTAAVFADMLESLYKSAVVVASLRLLF